MFAFISLGINYDRNLAKKTRGIYTFTVQRQMYHFIEDLVADNDKPRNLQLYFYDNESDITDRLSLPDNLSELLVGKLIDILKLNPYTLFLKSLVDVPKLSDFYIALKSTAGLDQ